MTSAKTTESTMLFRQYTHTEQVYLLLSVPAGRELQINPDAQIQRLYWAGVLIQYEFLPVCLVTDHEPMACLVQVQNLPPSKEVCLFNSNWLYRIEDHMKRPRAYAVYQVSQGAHLVINPWATAYEANHTKIGMMKFVEVFVQSEDGLLRRHLMRLDAFPPGTFNRYLSVESLE